MRETQDGLNSKDTPEPFLQRLSAVEFNQLYDGEWSHAAAIFHFCGIHTSALETIGGKVGKFHSTRAGELPGSLVPNCQADSFLEEFWCPLLMYIYRLAMCDAPSRIQTHALT